MKLRFQNIQARVSTDNGETIRPATADLYIYDEISFWGISADQFRRDLQALEADEIHVHINSPGGSVFDGWTIANLLSAHKAKIVTHVDGVAASIASVIALAGDEVLMGESSMFMVHLPTAIAWGDAEEMRKMAELLDKITDQLVAKYVKKTGKTEEEIRSAVTDETWYTALEAVAYGFADAIEEGVEAAAKWNPQNYGFPLQVAAAAGPRLTGEAIVVEAKQKPSSPQQKNTMNQDHLNLVKSVLAGDSFKPVAIEMVADGKDLNEVFAAYRTEAEKRVATAEAEAEKKITDLETQVSAIKDENKTKIDELTKENADLEAKLKVGNLHDPIGGHGGQNGRFKVVSNTAQN